MSNCGCEIPCGCSSGSLDVPKTDQDLCFCIKTFNVEISKVSKDILAITDHSDYNSSDFEELRSRFFYVKIKTPRREEFLVKLSPGNKEIYTLEELGISSLIDGVYCAQVYSCGDLLTIKIPYFPELECDLDNLIIAADDDSIFMDLKSKLIAAKKLGEYGQLDQMTKVYKNIKNIISGCIM